MKTNSILSVLAAALLVACGSGRSGDESPQPATKAPSTAAAVCPDEFSVRLETTKGPILIDVKKAWAPLGAQRFYELVQEGFFRDVAFFRVLEGFIAQAGIHGDPAVMARWRDRRIADDPVKQGNEAGTVTFAMGGPGSRTTQFFINLADNAQLDGMGFAAFGKVRDLDTVKKLYAGYGEGAPRGQGPSQALIQTKGNAYLKASFPQLDYILDARVE